MANLEKTIEISSLFRIYKNLLTEKQKEYFELYVDEDLSLHEIAEEFNISRSAVHDSISKTTNMLYDYENKLNLKANEQKTTKILDKYRNSNNPEIKQMIEDLEAE